MTPNLRAVVAQVYRGGRSIGSRNFSSSAPGSRNESMGAGGRVVAPGGLEHFVETTSKMSGAGLLPCTLFGYACYIALDVVEARKETKLRLQRRDELMFKMMRRTLSNE